MEAIRVRYTLTLALFYLLGGLLILTLGLLSMKGLTLFNGLLFTTMGVLGLFRPRFVVYPDRVDVRNLVGMTVRTHTFDSLADLVVRGGKLYRRGEESSLEGAGGWVARESG